MDDGKTAGFALGGQDARQGRAYQPIQKLPRMNKT